MSCMTYFILCSIVPQVLACEVMQDISSTGSTETRFVRNLFPFQAMCKATSGCCSVSVPSPFMDRQVPQHQGCRIINLFVRMLMVRIMIEKKSSRDSQHSNHGTCPFAVLLVSFKARTPSGITSTRRHGVVSMHCLGGGCQQSNLHDPIAGSTRVPICEPCPSSLPCCLLMHYRR